MYVYLYAKEPIEILVCLSLMEPVPLYVYMYLAGEGNVHYFMYL